MKQILRYSLQNKLIILLFTASIAGFGIFAAGHISIGAVPDITNNQVQVITTSRNLSTLDVEKFLTYPVELEMTNIPGVKEIRSVSKFGLSVVTVVFEEDMGTYLPRQLISEKLKTAEENIPEGFGKPFMGPISTGLGEIYQYIIDVDPAYKNKYSTSDLRSFQDWIVRRQLSGIRGVVEVNTWGGHLKQYEVAVNPNQLRAMNLSLDQIYTSLNNNNNIAGGGYIEKGNDVYFIRGEGLAESIKDIENMVVINRGGQPVYVKDVATVGFGYATRFGAITGNGEGEKVLGQVMMLKDANTKETIDAVKARVKEIEKSLPPGITINPFLERSDLLAKTTTTIAENLILGCLIVIFVVVLLLGNLRSGLVVASVIPLSLLFALGMMYIFNVDANLMSLGAIDFGIIIDGAVIIVEFIAYKISSGFNEISNLPKSERQNAIDKITEESTHRMMHSAFFGQIIILIVFIPIFSLTGVEGKMFRPMAMVFSFALIGAIILCFTWVPVISSLVLKPQKQNSKNFSRKLIRWIQNKYKPAIIFALRNKKTVLGLSLMLIASAIFIFSRMGGEFVPTLDEGDFVIQPVYKTGTSLNKTIQLATKMEKILKEFPEVNQVVTRIGAAEVPTDPMSMEETDVIITLFPKNQWKTAQTKDALADAFKTAIQNEMPGIEIEFTQPIEMRFNELITGVRSDLAIKIFGEDLNLLYKKANEIENAISNVSGAADISVEKITGLPEMSVKYNRARIAMYGLTISEVNDILQAGFGGKTAGRIFEGEKQFDLVVRYDTLHRKSIENIRNAFVTTPNGYQIPMSALAEIEYTTGPAKISRDETKRRVVVGVNVRGRDLESVVEDVQKIVDEEIKIPTGYTIEYGGQFENLRSARMRLMIVVPIALLLIFILLHFAFDSIRDAFLIFTAIPFSAVGGIFLLWLRGMPFSISAGVGFIALFGIAVLNGIVLIEHFKELKEDGMQNSNRRIIKGALDRMRPVLLTAAAAALGFLPMAVSSSAGAEVQKPLATVVIGGLVTSTLLTLIVLPVLYSVVTNREYRLKGKNYIISSVLLFMSITGYSQTFSLEEMQQNAIQSNLSLLSQQETVKAGEALVKSTNQFDPMEFFYSFDEANLAQDNNILHVLGASQSVKMPAFFKAKKTFLESKAELSRSEIKILERQINYEIAIAYYGILHTQEVEKVYQTLDSLYERFAFGARRKFELGESNNLEKITAEAKKHEIAVLLKQIQLTREKYYHQIKEWWHTNKEIAVNPNMPAKAEINFLNSALHPYFQYLNQTQNVIDKSAEVIKKEKLPELYGEVFTSVNKLFAEKRYSGFQIGIGLPVFGNKTFVSRMDANRFEHQAIELRKENFVQQYHIKSMKLIKDIENYEEAISYYNSTGKSLARELLRSANLAYKNGEIDFLNYAMLLESAKEIEITYLKNLNLYNHIVIELNYLN